MKLLPLLLVVTMTATCAAVQETRQNKANASTADRSYVVVGINRTNVDFFSKSPGKRAEIFDKVNFVYEIEAFLPKNKKLPLNEIYFSQVKPNSGRTLLVAGNSLTSVQQIKEAQAKGYKVCLGPLKNINEVVIALQAAPDYILLEKSLEKAKLRAAIMAQGKPVKNDREPIDLSGKGNFVLNYPSSAKRSSGTRLRILSYNILASCWNHMPQIAPRAPVIAEAIHHFKPDLIGIQEVEMPWYKALKNKIAPYQFVRQKDPADQGNPSCNILFNAERFRQLDGGILPYTDKWIRCLHWALLEDINTKERFLFTNTHWDLSIPKRLKNSRMMSAYLKDLTAKYDVPVICTGDFNSNTDSEELKELLKSTRLKNAVLEAPMKENDGISSCYWPVVSSTPYKGVKHIDHVLVSPELTLLSARLVLDRKLLEASDHLPLVVDLK